MEDKLICPAEITADKGMAPVITVNSPYDLDTVIFWRKYNVLRSSGSFTPVTAAASAVIAAVSAALGFYLITITSGVIMLMMIFVIAQIKPSAKRIYKRLYEGEELRRFSFYEEHFTAEFPRGAVRVKYDKIKNVVFCDRYIMIFLPGGANYILYAGKPEHDMIVMFLKEKIRS